VKDSPGREGRDPATGATMQIAVSTASAAFSRSECKADPIIGVRGLSCAELRATRENTKFQGGRG